MGKIDEILKEMLNTGIPGTLKPNEYGWKKIKAAKFAIRDLVLKELDNYSALSKYDAIVKIFEE